MVLRVAAPPTLIAGGTSATPARSADGGRRDVGLRRNGSALTTTISINQGGTTMCTARTTAASLAAVLVTAALAVGAASADSGKANVNIPLPAYVPLPASFAETETRPAKANVYVPPAAVFTDTVAPATAHANPQPAHRQRRNTSQDASSFDLASAEIGAGATGGLMLIVVGGFGAVHRARIRPGR